MKSDKNIDKIIIKGARTHNLKNISIEIPRNSMVAITGVSGSGKSSLAFDTIFAEGQRRYIESLSSYARQFLNQMPKPDVDEITGLSPAISIDQKSRSNNPRSTVATITEIYDYLRVMYARIGHPHCPLCGEEIKKLSNEEILNFVLEKVKTFEKSKKNKKSVMGVKWDETKISIFSPVVRGRKGEYYQLLYDLLGKGFSEIRLDGKTKKLREQIVLSKNKAHNIDILVDCFAVHEFSNNKDESRMRLAEALERALVESDGLVTVSFDSPEQKHSRRRSHTILEGQDLSGYSEYSSEDVSVMGEFTMSAKFACKNDGFSFPEIEPRLFSFNSPYGACEVCHGLGSKYFLGDEPCDGCNGARLRKEALNVFLYSTGTESKRKNILEISSLSIEDAVEFFKTLKLSEQEKEISLPVVREIEARLQFMLDVGLDYLQLSRKANTLSGGEAQRIRLASQLGSRLVGALYVLDEPTIGLHQRDNDRLIKTLENLRDLGNTILIVEHDEDTIYSSDYIVDIGPKAGVHGGEVIVSGWLEDLLTAKKNTNNSRTLAYLRGEEKILIPEKRRVSKGVLRIAGGKVFNIKNLNIEVPLGVMTTITGVSGSGKSSFMYEILYKNLQGRLERKYRTAKIFNCTSFSGAEYLSRAILIDQSPIGRTPRSNIATYTGAFTHIRDLFATTEEARLRGWKANRFSFNVKGGRCEACEGNGQIAVEMHFLPTVYVTCDVCNGKRFDKETLTVKYKKKNIYEVLHMTVEDGLIFFKDIPAVSDRLRTLMDVGLGYLELGQSATTLSGGEAQRVKISSELYRPHLEKTIYLLDEPTVGLHYDDVVKLLEVLNKLVSKGNTVVLIEHNLDVIKSSDYVIDIGPEGGINGGNLVAKGTPEDIANNNKSYTGKYLKKALKK
ncbi:MAG: UvrABC system protein A [Candidatus Nomurabacteria bacterium GW2011_GWE1_32_28]|uniref:UvrABC system protein A n=1 Tax=Candidatus Nomurabacteria bacterium GW2011_GWF1_31_48 TaxID=1618767 RepID=A0A0F9YV63_9BACT|nr:MAG: UvrABC system protein A [Candidatus Nomurabacteria bacterium GW2011_GWF2_30_133]KKP28773.1 MAG: UvrABC system protein A [Candidatus Nomurabacteria bacterium GW2011_GWE2_31_40]KKP30351.1 MAG: UvrABC system protein A [Candidatus Nomurabacteria bacterium GW2011_GWF1_31_48]KKP34878.1 MAG: UvrABC system protein A [Candidatus Nomurabacteria bacterium GW2011_GWE1_32_28]HAS80969.1 excinuclease ABC subunit A [Candidatus Nomurabacteria bacterium]